MVHALEICHQTGATYTSLRKQQKRVRPFRILKIGLNRPREELYNRINARVDEMMAQGLLDEARPLYPRRQLNALNTVGYKELFQYMDGVWPLEAEEGWGTLFRHLIRTIDFDPTPASESGIPMEK